MVFDLDDTLCYEWRFVASGARMLSRYLQERHGLPTRKLYEDMAKAALKGENHFDVLEKWLADNGVDTDVKELVAMHRSHRPDIHLPGAQLRLLEWLKKREKERGDVRLALITDGRSITQRRKIAALGLERYFASDAIFISGETGHDKHDSYPFDCVEKLFGEGKYYYVGDNPEKDFKHPNRKGWISVCLVSRGYNHHGQEGFPPQNKASLEIHSISELKDIIGK